jgi:hypothetical protein
MSFIESTPSERNDYALALRNALAAFKATDTLTTFVVKPSDLKRTTPYNAGGAFTGLNKLVKAAQMPVRIAKGTDSDTGEKVVAIVKK